MTQPVNNHTSVPVAAQRGRSAKRQPPEPQPFRDQVRPLRDGQRRRADQQQPMVAERAEAEALPPRRDRAPVGEGRAGRLHQVPERHAAGARRLAPAALHARLHELDEVVGDRRVLHCTARIAAMRPRGDSASSPVARNVGQCGRHNPQLTQVASSSWSMRRSTARHRTRHVVSKYPRRFMPEGHTIHRIARDQRRLLVGPAGGGQLAAGPLRRRRGAGRRGGARPDRALRQAPLLLVGERAGRPRAPRAVRQVPGAPRCRATRADRHGAHAHVDRRGDDRPRRTDRVLDRHPRRARRDRRPARSRSACGATPSRRSRSSGCCAASRRSAHCCSTSRCICGVGNVYRAEALFVNGIHPSRPGRELRPGRAARRCGPPSLRCCARA